MELKKMKEKRDNGDGRL